MRKFDNHKPKVDSEDYKWEQARVFYLPSLSVVLKRS
jgi:hypothetical protein